MHVSTLVSMLYVAHWLPPPQRYRGMHPHSMFSSADRDAEDVRSLRAEEGAISSSISKKIGFANIACPDCLKGHGQAERGTRS